MRENKVRYFDNLYNEGGEGYNREADIEEATGEARYVRALEKAWPLEETKARRVVWNQYATEMKRKGLKINILAMEKKMGFTHMELKVAIKHYNL